MVGRKLEVHEAGTILAPRFRKSLRRGSPSGIDFRVMTQKKDLHPYKTLEWLIEIQGKIV
jgi:hypothetical protein